MARFARDCLTEMGRLTRKLEVILGPDTADLAFRVGLHSGPVTGGVLRSDNARFQLFGDTMNTASRMESTGLPNRVQVSESTAALLKDSGKDHWTRQREQSVAVKGKGDMQTYWLNVSNNGDCRTESTESSGNTSESGAEEGLVTLEDDLNQMSATRGDTKKNPEGKANEQRKKSLSNAHDSWGAMASNDDDGTNSFLTDKDYRLVGWNTAVLVERVQEIVLKNQPDAQKDSADSTTPSKQPLSPQVLAQIQEYVTEIAVRYNNRNGFHNFEHASHVTLSIVKLLSKIDTHPEVDNQKSPSTSNSYYTSSITSDPLTKFAVVFSALVHDVEHLGVPNAQLVQEQHERSQRYQNKSVLENHSVDVAWGLFLQPRFDELRNCVCSSSESELDRLFELVETVVLATDIADKQLKESRTQRWNDVFGDKDADKEQALGDTTETNQLRAQIALEYLIQASDVSHTMQHWHVYRYVLIPRSAFL